MALRRSNEENGATKVMLYIPPILELSMIGVVDAGIPNRERVCLRPTDTINLAQFGLHAAIKSDKGYVTPIHNLFFWFGDIVVTPPCWLVILTGKGQRATNPLIEDGKVIYVFYWNLENVIFNVPEVVPVAFKIQSILIGHNVLPEKQRQIANPAQ